MPAVPASMLVCRDNKHTNHFLISPSSVTASQRNTAIRYRTGTLFNRKLAHRYRLAPHSRCLLCNREDSGHHTAAGCPQLTAMYTYRHDQAARQIVKAILRGRKSGFVVMMDIGNQQHCIIFHTLYNLMASCNSWLHAKPAGFACLPVGHVELVGDLSKGPACFNCECLRLR